MSARVRSHIRARISRIRRRRIVHASVPSLSSESSRAAGVTAPRLVRGAEHDPRVFVAAAVTVVWPRRARAPAFVTTPLAKPLARRPHECLRACDDSSRARSAQGSDCRAVHLIRFFFFLGRRIAPNTTRTTLAASACRLTVWQR